MDRHQLSWVPIKNFEREKQSFYYTWYVETSGFLTWDTNMSQRSILLNLYNYTQDYWYREKYFHFDTCNRLLLCLENVSHLI